MNDTLKQAPADALDGMFDQSQIPQTGMIMKLREGAANLIKLDQEIRFLEEQVEKKKKRLNEIKTKDLPELFDLCFMDSIGVPELNADVKLDFRYHANIKVDWPDEEREAAFDYLENNNGEGIVSVVLSIAFDRGEIDMAMETVEYLQRWNRFGNRPIDIKKGVPWNTLTAWFKREWEAGRKLDLNKIGATIMREAQVKLRKSKK